MTSGFMNATAIPLIDGHRDVFRIITVDRWHAGN